VPAAAGAAGSAAGAEGGRKQALKSAPVIGQLNVDGDLSCVGKRGFYKSAKYVKVKAS
jgi:hypothetical protein